MQWKDIDKQKNGNDDEGREGFSREMDSLCDNPAEDDVHQIMSIIFIGKKEKKEDAAFY